MNHRLVEFEESFTEAGVAAVCSCGWRSEPEEDSTIATAAHEAHKREKAKEAPRD